MAIKEIEDLSGMERGNIRFYEREGLITPRRMDNGYRDYSEEDLQILLRVKLLRSLHIPISEIKSLKEGNGDLCDILSKQIVTLSQEKQDVSYARDVCLAIREDGVSFSNLDADKYLRGIDRSTAESGSKYFTVEGDDFPQVFHPWRRYLARMVDVFIYRLLWSMLLVFVFNTNLAARSNLGSIFDAATVIVIMLFLEPLWLRLFAATPGKAIFGLRIETSLGRNLSYAEGLDRTWGVISAGMGYDLPIYNLVRLWKSYKLCSEKEVLPWDESLAYTIRDTSWYRGVVCAGIYGALILVLITIMSAKPLPPNRGHITVSEFAENHNFYAKYYDIDFGDKYLDEKSRWAEREFDGTVYLSLGYSELPEYVFTTEEGYVTGVSFTVEIEDREEWVYPFDAPMLTSALAYTGAQKEVGPFSKTPNRIGEQIGRHAFRNFDFMEDEIVFKCDVEHEGYIGMQAGILIPEDNSERTYFNLSFYVGKGAS